MRSVEHMDVVDGDHLQDQGHHHHQDQKDRHDHQDTFDHQDKCAIDVDHCDHLGLLLLEMW